MRASSASKYPLLALAVLAGLGAAPYRPAPKFEGKSIPDPPQQKEPWTPPQTKLPRFLVSAATALFEQGMADPRGCEYREVEVGDGTIIKTRGFVLPERAGDAGRFVVSWDGVVYPALSVGAIADFDKDIRTLAESMKRDREAAVAKNSNRFNEAGRFTSAHSRGNQFGPGGPSGPDGRSALKLCLLLRLGHADLAETLFAAGTTWTPDVQGRDLTDYQVSYLTLATDWAGAMFVRLVNAHMRGDDTIALDAARRLSTFAKAVETKAAAIGFQRHPNQVNNQGASYLPFLSQLPELLADHERRAKEPARGPIPKHGGDPTARIAALIRDLDQIYERQMSSRGGAYPGQSPFVRALIAEGEPAVEPLLTALETDMRLTRSVSSDRGMSLYRTVHRVSEAEFAALTGILNTNEFANGRDILLRNDVAMRKKVAEYLRAFWMKNRTISLNDRWYGILRDDKASPQRWLEAAGGIIQTNDRIGLDRPRPRKTPLSPMKGEALRSRRDPSVSELLARRATEIAGSADPLGSPNMALRNAFQFAMVLNRWDDKAALPVLRAMMTKCRDVIDMRRGRDVSADPWLSSYVPLFTVLRADAGDRESLDEYAAWFRKITPEDLQYQFINCFEPMWTYHDRPAIAAAARWLFNDPQSPWVPLLRAPQGIKLQFFPYGQLFTSPMVRVAGFREGLITALAGKAPMGTVRRGDRRTILLKTNDRGSWGEQAPRADLETVKPGVDLPFRVCDFLAWKVSSLDGAPDCALYWPEDRRDRAVEACVAYLKRYGDRFTAEPPGGELDFPDKKAHLAFPALGHPATLADVREGRAIFSLEGQGEVRIAKVSEFPILTRWVTLKDFPIVREMSDGVHHEFEQDGWIWQAEEVRKGDRWERYYGFVGPHVIARVATAEIELRDARLGRNWGSLASGLDAQVAPLDSHYEGYEPGRPILAAVRIRNRRGVANTAPTEYLRKGDGGQTALRRGVTLAVFYSTPSLARTGQGGPPEALKPKRTDRFDPGTTTRPLESFEAFEAMRLDLNEWFDLTRLGSYRAHVTFAADSGVGEGNSNDWYFTVGDLEGSVP